MRLIALLSVLLLSACATSPVPVEQANAVPSDRVYWNVRPVQARTAKVTFVRDTGFLGGGVLFHLSINGQKAASVDTGERVSFEIDPGEYVLGFQPTDAFGTMTGYTIDQDIKPGQQYFYRLLMEGNTFQHRIQRFIPN